MRFNKYKLLSVVLMALSAGVVQATPNPSMVYGVQDLMNRLDDVRFYDVASRVYLTPAGSILTEPTFRLLWAGQLFTKSDWIGIEALLSLSHRIDPGGKDDASNMFVYTCKGGWIDFGHVVFSAVAYKALLQALRGNITIQGVFQFLQKPEDRKLFSQVAGELRAGKMRVNQDGKRMGFEFWAGFFAIRSSKFIEEGQNKTKVKLKGSPAKMAADGNATSAYTLEDLPSNYYGILVAERLERKNTQRGVIKRVRAEFINLLKDMGAVDLNGRTRGGKSCPATNKEALVADVTYYKNLAETQQVTFRSSDSANPLSPYNYTITPKRTISHSCVCGN